LSGKCQAKNHQAKNQHPDVHVFCDGKVKGVRQEWTRMALEQIASFLVFLPVLYLPISPKQKGRSLLTR
jgi:hypothetical protein